MSTEVVRVAVVGLGGWGRNVVRSFAAAPRCELAAICDRDAKSLAAQGKLYPQARATDDYDSLLANESIDAVVLATPAPFHYAMARAALEAGKHVYVEKPMTLTEADAEALVACADRLDRKLMVGHLLEYHPAVDLVRREMEAGTLGDVFYMYCQRLNLGVVRRDENAFWSLAPHDISIILYLFGSEPSRITARGACFLQDGVEDVVFATLEFPDGRIAQVHVSWLDPSKARKMVLVGSRRMLVFDDMEPTEKVRIYDKGAAVPEAVGNAMAAITTRHGDIHIPHLPAAQPLDIETRHFVDSILNDTPPRSDGRDGLRVVRILAEVERQLAAVRGNVQSAVAPKPHRPAAELLAT